MPSKTKDQTITPKEKPVHEARVYGIRIPIWRNEHEGRSFHKAGLPEFSFLAEDGQWKDKTNLGEEDLVNLTKAAMLAHTEIKRRNFEAARLADDVSGTTEAE